MMDWISTLSLDVLGALAALGSALSWAVGSILFRRIGDDVSPQSMNLIKGLIGIMLLVAVSGLRGGMLEGVVWDGWGLGMLVLSGLVGIALGDTLFFMALIRLEPRRTLILATMGQVFTVSLAVLLLGERQHSAVWLGGALVVAGVTWVMREQLDEDSESQQIDRRNGMVYGLLASLCMSFGILFADMGVQELSALDATWVRLLAGMVGLMLWGAFRGEVLGWLAPLRDTQLLRRMFVAVCVIIFGGFYLSLLSLKLTSVTVNSVLTATEPLFILPLSVVLLREKLSHRAVMGALLTVGGVVVMMMFL